MNELDSESTVVRAGGTVSQDEVLVPLHMFPVFWGQLLLTKCHRSVCKDGPPHLRSLV